MHTAKPNNALYQLLGNIDTKYTCMFSTSSCYNLMSLICCLGTRMSGMKNRIFQQRGKHQSTEEERQVPLFFQIIVSGLQWWKENGRQIIVQKIGHDFNSEWHPIRERTGIRRSRQLQCQITDNIHIIVSNPETEATWNLEETPKLSRF